MVARNGRDIVEGLDNFIGVILKLLVLFLVFVGIVSGYRYLTRGEVSKDIKTKTSVSNNKYIVKKVVLKPVAKVGKKVYTVTQVLGPNPKKREFFSYKPKQLQDFTVSTTIEIPNVAHRWKFIMVAAPSDISFGINHSFFDIFGFQFSSGVTLARDDDRKILGYWNYNLSKPLLGNVYYTFGGVYSTKYAWETAVGLSVELF